MAEADNDRRALTREERFRDIAAFIQLDSIRALVFLDSHKHLMTDESFYMLGALAMAARDQQDGSLEDACAERLRLLHGFRESIGRDVIEQVLGEAGEG